MTSSATAPALLAREGRATARILRVLALLVLAATYTLILGLAVTPVVLAPVLGNWLTLAPIVVAPVALIAFVRRKRPRPLVWIGASYLVLAPVLAYLAIDDATLRHPVTLEEIAPAFPGAEKSFDVLMRYGKNHPLGRDFKAPGHTYAKAHSPVGNSANPAEWRTWLTTYRAEITADWADLAPLRAWWDELNTFDRIGDLSQPQFAVELVAFAPVRTYSQSAMNIAGLQAIDGHGDEAMATILTLFEVSRKLEPSSRTLVRFMISRVIQKMAIETANFILDTTPVSPAARARLLAAATGGSGGEAGARRMMSIEYAFGLGVIADLPMGDVAVQMANEYENKNLRSWLPQRLLNVLSPFAFNPHRTFNLSGDLTEQLQELAARREVDRMQPTGAAFIRGPGRPRFKNLFGTVVAFQSLPAFTKVTESYWKIEDARARLRERLAQP